MKALYKKMPTKEIVTQQVGKLCRSLGVKPPVVFFHPGITNTCEDDHILLMDPDWAIENDGPIEHMKWPTALHERYWETVIHEVAHWVTFKSGAAEEVDHRPLMYQVLIGIILREGLALDVLWRCESRYRPGSLSRGGKLAGDVILENALGQSPVQRETPDGVLVPFPTSELEAAI